MIVKDLKLCFGISALPYDCQRPEVMLWHFCSAMIAKDLKLCFGISALPYDCQRPEVMLWHFCSAILLSKT